MVVSSSTSSTSRLERMKNVTTVPLLACGVALLLFGLWSSKNRFNREDLPLESPSVQEETLSEPTTNPITLVSAIGDHPFDTIDVSLPHWTWNGPGKLIHFSSSIHPTKDLGDEAGEKIDTAYQLSSVWFAEVGLEETYLKGAIQGSMDDPHFHVDYLHFSCYFGAERTFGRVIEQERREYLLVTCPIPPSYGQGLNSTDSASRSKAFKLLEETRSSISVKFVEPPKIDPEKLKYIDPDAPPKAINSILLGRIPIKWESQYQKHTLGSCIAPIYLDESENLGDMLEWRIHQKSLGLEVVHWYGRNSSLSEWVTLLNQHFNLQDTFRFAPYVNPYVVSKGANHYHDQAMWYADCLARHSYLDEWIAITDLDEYILAPQTPTPFGSITKRLTSLPEYVGVLNLYQSYFGGPPSSLAPTISHYPRFPRDGGSRWTDQYKLPGNPPVRYPKAIHRTKAIITIWVHASTLIAKGYQRWDEEATAEVGNLLLLHSRREMYDGVEFIYDREVNGELIEVWEQVAGELKSAEELRKWRPSGIDS